VTELGHFEEVIHFLRAEVREGTMDGSQILPLSKAVTLPKM
jgi:hypothetical protein